MRDGQGYPSGLYIIATPIGNMGDMTHRAVEALRKIDILLCEDTRETAKLTQGYGISAQRLAYHEHNAEKMRPRVLDLLRDGKAVGLVSDAGMPLISDPGYRLVQDVLAEGFHVTCLPGASASLTALVLSGLATDRFYFAGFLPPKSSARRTALEEIKNIPATLIFYETAPRLTDSLEDMRHILGERRAAVARELTKKFEEVRRETLSDLIAHYHETGAPRGEIVVVVEGNAGKTEAVSEEDLEVLLRRALKTMTVRDAAAFVAEQTGWRKKDVYQRALELDAAGT